MDVTETWDINIKSTNTLYKTFKTDNSKYSEIITMQFDLENKYITEKRLYGCFGNITGLVKSQFHYIRISNRLFQCVSFYNPRNTGFSKYDQPMILKIRKQLIFQN